MAKQLSTENYMKAISFLKEMCEREIPIKKGEFLQKFGLSAHFWKALDALKVVEKIISSKKEGVIFEWKWRAASNEQPTFLPLRIMDFITEESRQAHQRYSSPEYQANKHKVEWRKEQKKKEEEKRKEQEETRKRLLSQNKPDPIPVIKQGPIENVTIPIPQPKPAEAEPDTIIENSPIPQGTLHFKMDCKQTKKQLLAKLGALIEEGTITAFELTIQY